MSAFHLFDVSNSIDHELESGEIVIGRGVDCDIRLLSSSVSRKHGALTLDGEVLTYSDLGSSNGSFVNGQPVTAPVQLNHGDELITGEVQLTVNREGAADPSEADEDATQLAAGGGDAEIPAAWSEHAGLEQASGTQFFVESAESEAAEAWRAGRIEAPPLGETPRLVGLTGDSRGRVFELAPGGEGERTWKLGREATSVDLAIPDTSVSAQHAQLVCMQGRWKIVNWMSTNGTFVNGQKGLSTYLQSGDVIRMGSAELVFELPARRSAGKGRAAAGGGIRGYLARLFGKRS